MSILMLPLFTTANACIQPAVSRSGSADDSALAEDQYGYQMWESSTPSAFIEVAPPAGSGMKVAFSSRDDGVSGQIALGFSFKFYEGTYSAIYIDTNGLIYFESQTSSHLNNHPLPWSVEPNNLVSPMWGDLNLDPLDSLHYPSGEVYTYFHNEAGTENDYFVIEWKQVYLTFTNIAVTFEAVLFSNGDIRFHYLNLPSDLANAVIGIENEAGDDGLMYWDGTEPWGLPSERVLIFERPDPAERGKLLPIRQGEFSYDAGATFEMTLINNGDSILPSSLYTIEPILSDQDWTASMMLVDGKPLPDIDSDGKFETGSVLKGAPLPFRVHLTPPAPLKPGDYVEVGLRLATLDESCVVTATLQSAVPLPFAQVFYQPPKGLLVEATWEHGSHAGAAAGYLAGNTSPSLVQRTDGIYAASWSGPCISPSCLSSLHASTDIQLSLLNGEIPRPLQTLTASNSGQYASNPQISSSVFDPLLAPGPNGQIGLVWSRWLLDYTTGRYNSNIEFALVDSSGESDGPLSLTGDSSFSELPHYLHPRLVPSENNRFIAFWLDEYEQSGSYFQRLYYRVVGADGDLLSDPYLLVDSGVSGVQFTDLSAASINGDQAMVLISRSMDVTSRPLSRAAGLEEIRWPVKVPPIEKSSKTLTPESIGYLVVEDTGGAPLVGYTPVVYAVAGSPRLIQNGSGTVLVAWSSQTSNSLGYMLFESTLENSLGAGEIFNLDGRLMDGLSLTVDEAGDFILTAMNSVVQDQFYYAAVDGSGALLTPRMLVYKTDMGGDYFVFSGKTGQQTAPYHGGYPLYLPQVHK